MYLAKADITFGLFIKQLLLGTQSKKVSKRLGEY